MTRLLTIVLALGFAFSSTSKAATDQEIIRGFNLTVFGAEFAPFGIQSRYIRKFVGPVRFKIHNLSKRNRSRTIAGFIGSLNGSVRGLRTNTTNNAGSANFNIYVVDRADYEKVARDKVYKRSTARVPGKCLVRSVFSRAGIIRSDAVIVSDGGEALFKRCMIEEILQGLGPLNEHPSLDESMFNDRSNHTRFTRFDRTILNMLYDKRIKNGATITSVQDILPAVLADAKRAAR
ncbi:MAG: DUF2927 domain-containing protein [Salaquimonas sp.]